MVLSLYPLLFFFQCKTFYLTYQLLFQKVLCFNILSIPLFFLFLKTKKYLESKRFYTQTIIKVLGRTWTEKVPESIIDLKIYQLTAAGFIPLAQRCLKNLIHA